MAAVCARAPGLHMGGRQGSVLRYRDVWVAGCALDAVFEEQFKQACGACVHYVDELLPGATWLATIHTTHDCWRPGEVRRVWKHHVRFVYLAPWSDELQRGDVGVQLSFEPLAGSALSCLQLTP